MLSITTSDNLKLYIHSWEAAAPTKIVLIVHGHGEHGGRYEHIAKNVFLPANNSVWAMDQRGHGLSEGVRGHAPSMAQLVADVQLTIETIQQTYPSLPIYIYGHSMGGSIVLNYLNAYPTTTIAALVTSPWIKLAFTPNPIQVKLAQIVKGIFPSMTQDSKLDVSQLSRDNDEIQKYVSDSKVHSRVSPALFFSCYQKGIELLETPFLYKNKLLLMHGSLDKITSCKASSEFYTKNKYNGFVYKEWEGGFHELHNDSIRKEVYEYINKWIITL